MLCNQKNHHETGIPIFLLSIGQHLTSLCVYFVIKRLISLLILLIQGIIFAPSPNPTEPKDGTSMRYFSIYMQLVTQNDNLQRLFFFVFFLIKMKENMPWSITTKDGAAVENKRAKCRRVSTMLNYI